MTRVISDRAARRERVRWAEYLRQEALASTSKSEPRAMTETLHPDLTGHHEVWRPCYDLPDYEVSNFGRVRSLRGKLPRLIENAEGVDGRRVVQVPVTIDGQRTTRRRAVADLVAAAFLPMPDDVPEGARGWYQAQCVDGNQTHLWVGNIAWAPPADTSRPGRPARGTDRMGTWQVRLTAVRAGQLVTRTLMRTRWPHVAKAIARSVIDHGIEDFPGPRDVTLIDPDGKVASILDDI